MFLVFPSLSPLGNVLQNIKLVWLLPIGILDLVKFIWIIWFCPHLGVTQWKLLGYQLLCYPYKVIFFFTWLQQSQQHDFHWKCSWFSLIGHLYKMHTFVKPTPTVGPCFLYSPYLTLYKTKISLWQALSAVPKVSTFERVDCTHLWGSVDGYKIWNFLTCGIHAAH